jgi:hypothetical protein
VWTRSPSAISECPMLLFPIVCICTPDDRFSWKLCLTHGQCS